jgi:hypothetical protein
MQKPYVLSEDVSSVKHMQKPYVLSEDVSSVKHMQKPYVLSEDVCSVKRYTPTNSNATIHSKERVALHRHHSIHKRLQRSQRLGIYSNYI